MKKTLFLLITAGVILAGCSAATQSYDSVRGAYSQGANKVPGFELQDINGNVVSHTDFNGKALVINLWATWCPFCREELPAFAQVQKEFSDDVVFIAIDRRESVKIVKKYTDDLGVTDDLVFLQDSNDSFYNTIGGFSMPETLFVDAQGSIVEHKRGPLDAEQTRQKVKNLLGN